MPRQQSNNPQTEVVDEAEVQPEQQIFNSENVQYFPVGRHVWRQQGPYLVCKACELHHGVFIGMDKVMTGETEEGKPIVRDRASI